MLPNLKYNVVPLFRFFRRTGDPSAVSSNKDLRPAANTSDSTKGLVHLRDGGQPWLMDRKDKIILK